MMIGCVLGFFMPPNARASLQQHEQPRHRRCVSLRRDITPRTELFLNMYKRTIKEALTTTETIDKNQLIHTVKVLDGLI